MVITAIFYSDCKKLLMLTFSLFSLINDCFFFSSRFRRPEHIYFILSFSVDRKFYNLWIADYISIF